MPEAKEDDTGAVKRLPENDYFKWYAKRFGGLKQKFASKVYAIKEDDAKAREFAELAGGQFVVTDYPDPSNRYLMEYYQSTDAVEPVYYKCHELARDIGCSDFIKITDVFAATEQSSMYGAAQQRLGLAQDRVAQYLRVINDMVKAMFQIIREMRILDERLQYYESSRENSARGEQAEVSLKGLWIDLVEGGAKNPGSVLGLGQQLGFTVLPDLFFRTHRTPLEKIKDDEEDADNKRVDDLKDKGEELANRIKGMPFNEKMKEVLARKLTQFYIWKDSTDKELTVRRLFMIKYFRQYYQTIKLYMTWVKPYLKQLRRLQLDISKVDNAVLISAFEGSMIEIELLCKKRVVGDKISKGNKFWAVMMLTLEHNTQPKLSFAAEGGFHRGPLHTGRTFITWRGYAWTDEDIQKYRDYRDSQDFELLGSVDSTLRAALDSVGGEIKRYLEDLGEEFAKKKTSEKKKEDMDLLEPLRLVCKGFWEPFESVGDTSKDWWERVFGKTEKGGDTADDFNSVFKESRGMCFLHYKLFKNSNGLLTW